MTVPDGRSLFVARYLIIGWYYRVSYIAFAMGRKGSRQMTGRFKIGDRVRLVNDSSGNDIGAVVQCQRASVYRVQLGNGSVRFYSGQQLELVVGNAPLRNPDCLDPSAIALSVGEPSPSASVGGETCPLPKV
jgi:hypothetical protein